MDMDSTGPAPGRIVGSMTAVAASVAFFMALTLVERLPNPSKAAMLAEGTALDAGTGSERASTEYGSYPG